MSKKQSVKKATKNGTKETMSAKKAAKYMLGKLDKALGKAPEPKQGICPACGRKIELPNGRGRCECGQAVLGRNGKLVRINEKPQGCLTELKPATTLEQPKAPEPAATAKPQGKKQERADGKMSGLDAAAKVLAEAGEPMNCKVMVDCMIAKGYWSTGGKTPAATIYSAILREIGKGEASRFKKTDRGKFEIATK